MIITIISKVRIKMAAVSKRNIIIFYRRETNIPTRATYHLKTNLKTMKSVN